MKVKSTAQPRASGRFTCLLRTRIRVRGILIVEHPVVTLKCRTAIQVLFLYCNFYYVEQSQVSIYIHILSY